jgi:quinol monooxygenase YgiN
MIIVTGSILARPETFAAIRDLALQHVARSRGEAGCERHTVHVDVESPLRLVFVERWTNRAALATHFADPQAKAFVAAVRPLAAEAPGIDIFEATRVSPREL